MMPSKTDTNELDEIQKTIAPKIGNVTFLKKVKLEKGGNKYVAISTSRFFILATKAPYKIESSFHLLEIQSIESVKPALLHVKVSIEKQATHVMTTEDGDDIHFIIAHLFALLRYNFPGSKKDKDLQLKVEPADKLDKINKLSEALANSTSDSEIGPCGGFSQSYSSVCDLHGVKPMAELIWDVDKIYGSHGCKDFKISDFDHLEAKDLIPVLSTFEYNNWFRSFSCRSYKLSTELVDILVKVFKSNTSIEEIDLYECRLTKENIQKLSQAISSNSKTALKKINFGKNAIEDRGAPPFCTVLSSLPHGLESLLIKEVNISAKGAASICSALKSNQFMSSTLSCVSFASNPLKADGASAVCEFLANVNVIRELNLSNSECALELVFGALARGCLQHLKVLNLSGNPYSYRKGKEIQSAPSVTKFFSSSMALESVNLSNTKISAECVKAVLMGLIGNGVLKDVSLDLSKNELRSAGAAEVSSCISGIANVSSLDLSDNGLDMDLVVLCQNIQKNKSLRHLNISQNVGKSKNVNVAAILESLVEMIMSETLPLKSLSVSDCRLRQDADVLIDALGTNYVLEELDITGNLIGDEGARNLAKALQINTKLRKIDLDRNGITLKGFSDIATSLQRNYSLHMIPTPFGDILPLIKHNGPAVTKCFRKIDDLLLRNQSKEIADQDHSIKLKQNLLLNSLDQESTDLLLVKVQDSIGELQDITDDETIAKEVEIGKNAIKDADKMKEVLFKLFVDINNPSEKIEDRAQQMMQEMTSFANHLVKQNIDGTLSFLKEQCPTIAGNSATMAYLEKLISTKGAIDSLCLKETIVRSMVGQISNNVSDATLQVASSVAEHLTNMMQETLERSKVKLNLLSMERKENATKDENVKKGDSWLVVDTNESLLAAQKAKNRISTLVNEEGGTVRGKGVKRRPTFRRENMLDDVAVEISIDEVPVSVEEEKAVVEEDPKGKENTENGEREELAKTKEDKGLKESAKTTKENKELKESTKTMENKELKESAKTKESKESKESIKTKENKESIKTKEDEKLKETKEVIEEKKEIKESNTDKTVDKKEGAIPDIKKEVADGGNEEKSPLSRKKGLLEGLFKPNIDGAKRAATLSVKEPKKMHDTGNKKPRPLSDAALDMDRANALSHLNKGRAKPKGRRPPSRAAGLAHLTTEEVPIHVDEPDEPQKTEKRESPKPEKKDLTPDSKKLPLKPSPKPRPKSMQALESPDKDVDKDAGVIRTGSIPHSSSISMKARLKSEGDKPDVGAKPEIPKSPKPEIPKKEDSLKKPKPPIDDPMAGLPEVPGLQGMLMRTPSARRREESEEGEAGEGSASQKSENNDKHENENSKEPEVAAKPKKYKPPGGVALMGGPGALGGALMAEMKKKQGRKDSPGPEPASEEPKKSPKPDKKAPSPSPPVTKKPVPAQKKPPPPAKLSQEKRKSLILDSGPKPVILDKPDGPAVAEKQDMEKVTEENGDSSSEIPKSSGSVGSADGKEKGSENAKAPERNNNTELTEKEA